MNYSAAHYRDLANYDTLVIPLQVSIAPLIGNGLERWYINQVIRRTYLAVTGVSFMCRTSTSAGGVMLQVLPPRPVSPVGRPACPTLDEFGYPLAPPPRRLSKLNILRRVRLVLLAVRKARATYFATALVQYEQKLRRAADPFAAQAARLKQCAEHLLSLKSPLNIIAMGETPDQVGQRSELPSGQRYYFPLGWPVEKIAKLLAEIQLFDKLHREFEANILAQPLDTPAAPATTDPPQLVEQHNDLPLAVRKRLDYFPQLLARLVSSPIWDTHEILDEALTHYKAGEDDLYQGQKFIARLKHYLEPTPMDAERREQIESWAFSTQQKEDRSINDIELPEWKAVVTEADRAMLERRLEVFTTTGRRIVQRDKGLDSYETDAANMERQIAQIEKRLAELNAASDLNIPLLPDMDVNEMLGILKLDYKKTELDSLLRSLKLIEDAPSLDAKMDTKPAQWVAVIKALDKRLSKNKKAVFTAFSQRYGKEIGSLRAFQLPYNGNNDDAGWCYTRALALLGKA